MTESVETPEVEAQPEPEAKGLRAQLEAALAENRELKADKRNAAFVEAGFDVEKGLGKAIAKEYDGELTPDAVRQYATTEYGWEPSQESTHPQAEEIQQGQERLEQIGQTAGSVADPSAGDRLAQAEVDGDYQTTMAMKTAQLADQMFGSNRR